MKNPTVASRLNDQKTMHDLWCWFADGWGVYDEPLEIADIIAQDDAPLGNLRGRSRVDTLRAAINKMAREERYPLRYIKRGWVQFTSEVQP